MGRVPYGPEPGAFDLYRFSSPATLLFLGGSTAPAVYFRLTAATPSSPISGQASVGLPRSDVTRLAIPHCGVARPGIATRRNSKRALLDAVRLTASHSSRSLAKN